MNGVYKFEKAGYNRLTRMKQVRYILAKQKKFCDAKL
jgi:hypothetical protein